MVSRQNPASPHGLDSNGSTAGGPVGVNLSQATLVFVVLAPGVVFAALALLWLLGWVPQRARCLQDHRRDVFRLLFSRWPRLLWKLGSAGAPAVMVTFGNWFAVHDYHFPAGADGGPALAAVPRHDRRALRTDRAVLGDLPPSRARLFSGSFCCCTFSRSDLCSHSPPARSICWSADGRWWASLRCC